MISDDLTPLFKAGDAPSPFRQGTVVTFDAETGSNTVNLAGTVLANLPVLNSSDTVKLAPGDVVILARFGASYAILGRILVPGSGALFTAALDGDTLYATDQVLKNITTSYTTYANGTLTTPPWANNLLLIATTTAVLQNTTAGDLSFELITDFNDSGGAQSVLKLAASGVGTLSHSQAREFYVGAGGAFELTGSTTVKARLHTLAGTATNGHYQTVCTAMAIFRRT